MSGLFYKLGRKVGPKVRRAKWVWRSLTGTEADAIKVENDVGRELAREIRRQSRPDPDPEVERLLGQVGLRLARCVANRFRTFSFEVVQGSEANAFALPGGFIFVTRPLVDLCGADADKLAFIVGHEMAHVIRGHAMNRIISNCTISAAARIAPARGLVSAWVRKVGVSFLESAYSQELESEADRLGVRLAAAAKYDARAAVGLLAQLARLSRGAEALPLGTYFSSHPAFEQRISAIERLLGELA